ncbi:MAG: hypothetical protein ACSHYB_11910 [Roseibacillus sp.]
MKAMKYCRGLTLFLGTVASAHAAPILVPNGDFENASGPETFWQENNGDGTFFYDYLTADGNPDGQVIISNTDGAGFGLLIANQDQAMTLGSLGLAAGQTYSFQQDMQFDPLAGSSEMVQIGGLKVEFYDGTRLCGSTGDLYPDLIGDGSTWETYSFEVHVPAYADGVKVILLWGAGSAVAFDNVQIEQIPLAPITTVPNGDFEIIDGDSWGLNDDGGATPVTFPATGGNGGGGYAEIDASTGSFGVLISLSDQPIPIAGLGLVAGQAYNFQQDMNLFSGSDIGGLKVEFFTGSDQHSTTGNLYPTSNSGNVWATYDFPIQIPPNVSGIKVIPLWGPNSVVGYDNITIGGTTTTPPIIDIPNGDFSAGDANWITAGEPDTIFSYPSTGGNSGGYALLENDGNGFGVLVANEGSSIPLGRLGLSPSTSYTFSMDTYRNSGSEVGKLKIEFFGCGVFLGDSGDIAASTVTGAWTTDDFIVSLPSNADALRVVPVAGIGSAIRFDNITVDNTPVVAPLIPNLDFEQGGASWSFFQGGPTVSYPAADGNPDGYGRIDATAGGWGVLVPNSNNPVLLADLGLTAGTNIDVNIDMRIISGANIGKVKIEYYSGTVGGQPTDQTVEAPPTLINGGTDWETYSYTNLFVPETISSGGVVDAIKIVLVHGDDSVVGYDNVEIVIPNGTAAVTITDCGFDSSGNFYIDVEEGVSGLRVTTSTDLNAAFTTVTGATNNGANRFTIPPGLLDGNSDGADFFRVETLP